jgi:hypothetical protein
MKMTNVQGTKHQQNDQKNVEKIRELIHEDHRRTIHELTDTVGISYEVCKEILENLNTHHTAAKFVPRLLTNDQITVARERVSCSARED